MKVVFVADLLNPSASGHQRLWAMQQCGAEVVVFDKTQYPSIFGRFSGKIAKLLKQPLLMRNASQLGKRLVELCKREKPDMVWIEWAREIQPVTMRQLKGLSPQPLLISFQDDNPWGDRISDQWMWKGYFKLVPYFDLHVVKRPSDIRNLEALGGKKFELWRHGMYSPLFYPAAPPLPVLYPVSFVGTCMDNRTELIGHLLENNIPVHVFGNRWQQRSDLPERYPANFHPPVVAEDYADVIRQSQICLGLVSHSNHDEWTMRTYEVPACAKLLMVERTPYHEALFEEDKDAVFFSNHHECANKLLTLLPDQELCDEMGKSVYRKFIDNRMKLEYNMRILLNKLIFK